MQWKNTSYSTTNDSDLFIKEIIYLRILIGNGEPSTIYISSFSVTFSVQVANTNFRQEKYAGNTKEEAPHIERTLEL